MRILHTADWHLGRMFQQMNLLDDQAVVVDQILDYATQEKPDLVIIAGDIFDRAAPRREAIELFSSFLRRLSERTRAALCVIAGNHDSPELISFAGVLRDSTRTLIAGTLDSVTGPLMLEDKHGLVAVEALPYAEIFAARHHFTRNNAGQDCKQEPIFRTPNDVLTAQIKATRQRSYSSRTRQILVAHAFVQGGRGSQSERSLDLVGGIETVPATAFDGAHYVALGHLHRAQAAGAPHIRYSGSIMRFGFDEVDIDKSAYLVELDAKGDVSWHDLPLIAPRTLRIVEGFFDDVLAAGARGNLADFIKFNLKDRAIIPDAMNRLRALYPNAVQIEWMFRSNETSFNESQMRRKPARRAPRALVDDFFSEVLDKELSKTLVSSSNTDFKKMLSALGKTDMTPMKEQN